MTVMAPPPPPPYEKYQAQGSPPITISSAMFPSPSFGRDPVTTVCRNCHSNVRYLRNLLWRPGLIFKNGCEQPIDRTIGLLFFVKMACNIRRNFLKNVVLATQLVAGQLKDDIFGLQ